MQHLVHVVYDAVPSSWNLFLDICKVNWLFPSKICLDATFSMNILFPRLSYLNNHILCPYLALPIPLLILLFYSMHYILTYCTCYVLLTKLKIWYLELKEIPV